MTAPTLKLVPNDPIKAEIDQTTGDMLAAKKAALMKRGGPGGDVLPPVGERYDDLANSQRFLSIIGDEMLYVPEQKKWLIWDVSHWSVDRDDFVFDYAAEFAAGMYETAGTKEAIANAQNKDGFSGDVDRLFVSAGESAGS